MNPSIRRHASQWEGVDLDEPDVEEVIPNSQPATRAGRAGRGRGRGRARGRARPSTGRSTASSSQGIAATRGTTTRRARGRGARGTRAG